MSGSAAIAARLQARLGALCSDPALDLPLRLTLADATGHGDLEPIMRACLRFIVEAEQAGKKLREQAEAMQRAIKATNAAAQGARAALAEAMQDSGAPAVLTSYHRAGLRPGRPKAVVTNLDALPTEYVRTERKARLDAIAHALAAGETVPGATLSNAEPVLEVRVRASEVPPDAE